MFAHSNKMAVSLDRCKLPCEKSIVNLFEGSKSYEAADKLLQYKIIHNAETDTAKEKQLVPHYSDKQKVGFFSQDRSSQTEITDVVNLKEMMIVVNQLLTDIKSIKRDIQISKQIMQSDYKITIKNKALELYSRINTRVRELEIMHTDKVKVIRRAYKQQLNNALIAMQKLYQNKLDSQLRRIHGIMKEQASGQGDVEELKLAVTRSESMISMLQLQLEAARVQAKKGRLQIVIEELRFDNGQLEEKVHLLEDEVHIKEKDMIDIRHSLSKTKDANDKLKQNIDQLKIEHEERIEAIKKSNMEKMDKERSKIEMMIRAKLAEEQARCLEAGMSVPPEESTKLRNRQYSSKTPSPDKSAHHDLDKIQENDDQYDQVMMSKTKSRKTSTSSARRTSIESGTKSGFGSARSSRRSSRPSSTERHLERGREKKRSGKSQRSIEERGYRVSTEIRVDDNFANLGLDFDKKKRKKEKRHAHKIDLHTMQRYLENQRHDLEKEHEQQLSALHSQMIATELKLLSQKNEMSEDYEKKMKILLDSIEQLKMEKNEMMQVKEKPSDLKTARSSLVEDKNLEIDCLKIELDRLKRELERVHKVWEKKFSVLQLSLYALKDESYIRHSLERQSATLHRNNVNLPKRNAKQMKSGVLVNNKGLVKMQGTEMQDERFTPKLKSDENQIMESTDNIPSHIAHLPQP